MVYVQVLFSEIVKEKVNYQFTSADFQISAACSQFDGRC